MHFNTYFCFCFSLIFDTFPRAAAFFFAILFFVLFFNLISWHQKYQIKYKRKLLCVIHVDCRGVKLLWISLEFLIITDAAIISKSFIFIICILTGWKKKSLRAKRGLKLLWIHCQNSALIMTNGKRRLGYRSGYYQKILDSCKFISDSASEYGLVYSNLLKIH